MELDVLRALVSGIDFVTAILTTIFPSEAVDTAINVVGCVLKSGILFHFEEYSAALQEIESLLVEELLDPDSEIIETVFEAISIFQSFDELLNSVKSKPRYYCDIIDYCVNKVNYIVVLELASGEKIKLENIEKALMQ